MSKQSRSALREVGAGFALLAIYVLTLLTPLHQTAGLQRDLARLGLEAVHVWSICAAIDDPGDEDDRSPSALNCPVTGIGKPQLALSGGASVLAVFGMVAAEIVFPVESETAQIGARAEEVWPRAPPVSV